MANGTKMTLHRYGGRVQDWKDQLIVVDQEYLNNHSDLLINLDYPYEMGNDLLEVYFNGQRLSQGGGYLEIDDMTIQVDLGVLYEGSPVGFEIGDEIYIKFWENHYYNRGGSNPSPSDITKIFKTIEEIVNYGGASNLDMEYEHNELGQIVKEVSVGAHNIIREFTYNEVRELESETIIFDGKIVRKTYEYDFSTGKLLRTKVRVLN